MWYAPRRRIIGLMGAWIVSASVSVLGRCCPAGNITPNRRWIRPPGDGQTRLARRRSYQRMEERWWLASRITLSLEENRSATFVWRPDRRMKREALSRIEFLAPHPVASSACADALTTRRISGAFRFGLREQFLAFRMRGLFSPTFPSSHRARGLRGPWPAAWMMVKRLPPGR